jgi:hypothetical protein
MAGFTGYVANRTQLHGLQGDLSVTLGTQESQRWVDLAAAATLLVAVLILFAPALSHPNYLLYPTFVVHSDLTVAHWPKAYLMAQSWRVTHSLPLWTPANLSGMPLAANPVAMRFYPPAWLFLFLPLNSVFNLLFVFHLFWGGLGVYWLLRTGFGLDPISALAGGLTFALGGKLLAHVSGGHVIIAGAIAWMPWALLGTHRLLREGHLRWAGLAGVALAMQITTDVRIVLYTAYLLVAYVFWELVIAVGHGQAVRLRSTIPRLVIVPALAALLGAAQLLPLLKLAGYSNRALSLAEAGNFALTPLTLLVGLLLPDAGGGPEMVVYLGLVPLVLAFFGLHWTDVYPANQGGGMDRRSWFFGGVLLLAILFALGRTTLLFELVYRWVPGFRWVRAPARAFFPASLAVAILAGMGVQRLAHGQVRWSTPVALAVGTLTLGLGLGLVTFFGQVSRAALGLAILPSLALLVVGLTARCRLPTRLALPALALLLFADLASFDLTLIRFLSPSEAFAEGGAVADYIANQPGLFRTYSPSYSLPSHVAARADLQTADGVEGAHLVAYDHLMALAGGYGDPSFSVTIPPFPTGRSLTEAFRGTQPDLRLLGLLNVEYIVAAFPMDWPGLIPVAKMEGTFIYRNQHALPRAWIVSPLVTKDTQVDTRDNWARQLIALAEESAQSIAMGEYQAWVTHYEPDRIEVEAQLPRAGTLILSEIWYPGWQAKVDGLTRPVERIGGVLRGVQLDSGTHHIVLVYAPAPVRWGKRLSLVGIMFVIGWIGFELWLWRQSRLSRPR